MFASARWVVASLVVLSMPAAAVQAADGEQSTEKKPRVTWAHIEVTGEYPETPQFPGLFGDLSEGLTDAVARLDKAADDPDVAGVVLKIDSPTIGWGKLHELRQGVARIRAKGKPVQAWLPVATTMDYLLATACDEIVMPESGFIGMVGLRAEVTFYKNLFDKLGLKADMLRVGEYKSAAEPYTRTEMSPEFREEMEALLDDYYRQVVETIAQARGLEPKQLEAAIDGGPHSARAAHALGLIDRVAYEDEMERRLQTAREDAEFTLARKYAKKKVDTDFSGFAGFVKLLNLMVGVPATERKTATPKIAVIHASGMIMTGKSLSDLFGGSVVGSDTLVKAIQKAGEDGSVRAVVLRVDSPGGSALASDLIWRALQHLDKPVVVSMGDVAASGGYYISMGADTIFAEPGTLTGSIGVVGGKFALKGLFEKFGVTTDVVSRGKNSGAMSLLEGFSESERAAMQRLLNEVYEQFTRKAAAGRKMKYEDLERLARGRVYTGAMAQKLGLVDRLGTLEEAVAHARQLAGLSPDEKVERLVLPRPVSPFETLFGPLDPEAGAVSAARQALLQNLSGIAPEAAATLRWAELVGRLSPHGPMTLLPFHLRVR